MQIRAMKNRASRGMTVHDSKNGYIKGRRVKNVKKMVMWFVHDPQFLAGNFLGTYL